MKQVTINKILNEGNIPFPIIHEKIQENMNFPIFKISEKSHVDAYTDEDVKTTEMVCSHCNHRFTSNERYVSNPVCPMCGNEEHGYSLVAFPDISDTFTFDSTIDVVVHSGDRSELKNCTKVQFIDKTSPSRSAMTIRDPLILDSQVVDGEKLFILREFEMFLNTNKDTGKRTLYLVYTYNTIIFGENEIVNIRDGKKSSAMFNTSYGSYYSYRRDGRCFIATEDMVKKFNAHVDGYKIKHTIPSVVNNTSIHNIYALRLDEVDTIVSSLKDMKPVSSITLKRQELVKSILDKKPAPMPFVLKNDKVCYSVVEVNEMENLMTFEYVCPSCEEVVTGQMQKRNYDSNDEYVPCPNCGAVVARNDFADVRYVENTERVVNVIQNFEDGIIIYDATYVVSTYYSELRFEPTLKPANEIFVIRGDFNNDNLMSNVTILRRDNYTKKYSIAKTFKFGSCHSTEYIRNEATNFNMNWSAVERLNDFVLGYNYTDIDTIVAYALLYKRYTVLEKFMKEDMCVIAKNIISTFDWVNSASDEKYDLEQKDVASVLRMSKGCLRILKKAGKEMMNSFHPLQLLYGADNNLCEEDYNYICEHGISVYKIVEICNEFGFSVHDVCGYLERVRIAQCVKPYTAANEWLDYLVASRVIGCDLKDKRVKYPSALRTEHDKVVYKKNIIENEEFEERFKKVTDEYGKKFAYKGKDFVMTYPKTISDLFEEGRVLNHCVGSYGDAIKSGNSIVLFIRKKKEIDTPYFTLEVDPTHNAVTQIGGYSDVAPHHIRNKELIEFIKEWAEKKEVSYSTK